MDVVKSYVGRELQPADTAEVRPLWTALGKLVPTRAPITGYGHLAPKYIWEYGRVNGPTEYLMLEYETMISHPGSTPIRLSLFDSVGNLRIESKFHTGWRCYMSKGRLTRAPGMEFPIVVVESTPSFGPDRSKQFYTMIGDRFDLIRLENTTGVAVRNSYYVEHFASGPWPVGQSEQQWEADLYSIERAKVLRALFWLGGSHDSGWVDVANDPRKAKVREQAALVRKVRANPTVAARLQELSVKGDSWEREAAALALNPEDTKFD